MRCTTDDVAGYSLTPQLQKLGIAPGVRLDVVDADPGWSFEGEPGAAAGTCTSSIWRRRKLGGRKATAGNFVDVTREGIIVWNPEKGINLAARPASLSAIHRVSGRGKPG